MFWQNIYIYIHFLAHEISGCCVPTLLVVSFQLPMKNTFRQTDLFFKINHKSTTKIRRNIFPKFFLVILQDVYKKE